MRKKVLPDEALLPIVGDGAIAVADLGEGRLIPVLVVDCARRLDMEEFIRIHEHLGPGDVDVTWAHKNAGKGLVYLILEFKRPSRIDALLEFDIVKQGPLVEGILHSRGVYLQPRSSGATVTEGLTNNKILVEVPDTDWRSTWEELVRKRMGKHFRKQGLTRRAAEQIVKEMLGRQREMWSVRVK